jgi:DNA repair exonuclease SbcCD ATPase subunit
VIAEGNETPGGESGSSAAEGRGRRSEGDLLAERRARRAAESGEHALTLRAEAAEATVRTLETHVTSLQQRLADAEQERRSLAEQFEQARPAPERDRGQGSWRPPSSAEAERLQHELQRVSQREYAEQRLRIEAEERCSELEREARGEIDRLARRLEASERDAQALTARLEAAERELAEAEQTAGAQRTAVLRTEHALRMRLGELEGQAEQIQASVAGERAARERAERLLETLQEAQRGALTLLGGVADAVARLREATLERARSDAPAPPPIPIATSPSPSQRLAPASASAEQRGGEMAEALAAAVERLRARAEVPSPEQPPAPPLQRSTHKHSMSLIARMRLAIRLRRERRKQRRAA